jgi:hypothetical protein
MTKQVVLSIFLLIVALAMVACGSPTLVSEEEASLPINTAEVPPPTENPIIEPTDEIIPEPEGRTHFEQLGISLEIPQDLVVIKEPIINLDDPSKLESYIFYIQNYGPEEGPGEDYFQMYGLLQYSIPQVNWEEYTSDVLNSDMYSYAEEIEVNGLQGLDTQVAGVRNRFVYFFSLDGRVLTIAVADPTEENKALADQIIDTLQFTPGSVTDASKLD